MIDPDEVLSAANRKEVERGKVSILDREASDTVSERLRAALVPAAPPFLECLVFCLVIFHAA